MHTHREDIYGDESYQKVLEKDMQHMAKLILNKGVEFDDLVSEIKTQSKKQPNKKRLMIFKTITKSKLSKKDAVK